MSVLFITITVKIFVTLFFVAIPFLFLSSQRLDKLTAIKAKKTTFYRLYGVAVASLLVGYASAYPLLWQGFFPWHAVSMGIVSNVGAAFFLFRSGSMSRKNPFALIYGGIALALIMCAIFPKIAATHLFSI